MSTDTEHVDERSVATFLETWEEWYHIPVVGFVMLFMFWTRVRSYGNFGIEDGRPALTGGPDSYYHWRTVEWTAENYPDTMPYELWTSFPTGRYVGQFGTLFDQLIVTVAMIVGLGDPSTETLYAVAILTVPAMAALVAIPVFLIGRRLGGTVGGLTAVVLLALAPGEFFGRSVTGQIQHHVAEVLFMAVAILALMVALRVTERDQPIWELVESRDWPELRDPAKYSVLAGIALSLYLWVWPAGVVLLGIVGVFFVVQLSLDFVRGVSPDHVAFVGVISMGIPGAFMVVMFEVPTVSSVTSFGFLQPAVAFLVVGGCVFMAWLARQWSARGIERSYYPVAIAGVILGSLGLMALLLPDLYNTLIDNLTGRLVPIDPGTGTETIAEAQQPEDFAHHAFEQFGMAFYTMLAGLLGLVASPYFGRAYRAEYTLILVWSLFLISMAMTQVRFAYYLVLAVAVANAVFIAYAIELLDLDRVRHSIREVETYQVIGIILIVGVLLFPLTASSMGMTTVWDRGEDVGPHYEAMTWEEANQWMADNTPEPGDWAGADNASELDYYGTYEYPEGGDYDYPVGTYGVMSWWDYGHYITAQSHRIPHSNPFQSNAHSSSAFLQAQDEAQAEAILDAIAEGDSPELGEDGQFHGEVSDETDSSEEIRYVMIDDAMAGGKFNAITQWTGPDYGTYLGSDQYTFQGSEQGLATRNDDFADTMLASMYLSDASGLEHYRLVHEVDTYSIVGSTVSATADGLQTSPHYSLPLDVGWEAAQAQVSQLEDANENGEVVPVGTGLWVYDAEVISSVKTFERVEGATLTGTVDESLVDDENATVTASVELETEPGRPFTYTQETEIDEDGAFELTVPYATDEEVGPEDGYTNSSVLATGAYEVTAVGDDGAFQGETSVPEMAIIDGDEIEVTLEEIDEEELDADEEEDDDGSDGDDEADGDEDESDEDEADSDEDEPEGNDEDEDEPDVDEDAIEAEDADEGGS